MVLALGLTFVAGACGGPGAPAVPGTGGSGGAGTGGGGAGGSNQNGGDAGTDDAPAIDSGGDVPSAGCAPGAVWCDDFESYPLMNGMTTTLDPNWVIYKFHGSPRVDNTKPYGGKQNAHVDTEAGDLRYAGFVHQTADDVAAVPSDHYGRVMVWLKALPAKSDWNIIHVSGLLPGSTTKIGQFSFGGVNGKLAVSYLQRTRVLTSAGAVALRGGGRENSDPLPDLQCSTSATTETLVPTAWVCVEWHVDGASSHLQLWLDGRPQTEVEVTGKSGACSIGAAPAVWQAPTLFNKVVLDWEAYQKDAPQQDAWFDNFAVGTQRLGCPTATGK
jgi:hypothetical protein